MTFQTRLLPDNLDVTTLCKQQPGKYPFALTSTAQSSDSNNGRYDIFFAYPQQSLQLDQHFRLQNKSGLELDQDTGFLDAFDQWWSLLSIKANEQSEQIPFTGGWFIYLSYELAAEIEPCLTLPAAENNMPVALAVRCPAAIIVDHQENKIIAVAEYGFEYLLDRIERDCNEVDISEQQLSGYSRLVSSSSIKEAEIEPYLEQVVRIKQYIKDGDIFQANLSRNWLVEINNNFDSVDVFRTLCKSNPASFAALAQLEHGSIISSSPERLVRSDGIIVETRPIAGTRPRVAADKTDEALAKELLTHPKEQAEHIMLIDLERNDLGRICKPGSVEVNELMGLETYQHVHHIVSNVKGQLRENVSPADIIKAVFPGGTITGCPKIRCMEILAEMEQQARGAYTGSLGYINRDGSMDLNILIRTMVRNNSEISFRAGGGIVADSLPQHELEETRAKARGLLNVFELQEQACSV